MRRDIQNLLVVILTLLIVCLERVRDVVATYEPSPPNLASTTDESPDSPGATTPATSIANRCQHCSTAPEDHLTNHCLAHLTRAERTLRGLSEQQWRDLIDQRRP